MQDDVNNGGVVPASVTILVPAAQFGSGQGQYWRQHRINGLAKRAIVDGDCTAALEHVDERSMQTQIWENLCADLRKYALDAPHSDIAEHVRQGRFMDGLAAFARFIETTSGDGSREKKLSGTVVASEQTWDQVILDFTVRILKESAVDLPPGYQFYVSAAQWLFLLVYKRTNGGFFNPRVADLSKNYFEKVFAENLAKVPKWFEPDQDEYRRTIKGWDDLHKPHVQRISRAKHVYQDRRTGVFSYQLTLTGESYVFKHLLRHNISHKVLTHYLEHIDQHPELFVGMPPELKQDPDRIKPDQDLVALNVIARAC